MNKRFTALIIGWSLIICILNYSCQPSLNIDYSGPVGDWVDYGGSKHGDRYSPINQITPDNVHLLEVAWEYHTGDFSDGSGDIKSPSAFEATPILVDSILYIPTPFNRVLALHPETGQEVWKYDPKIDLSQSYANQLICRGVSYWKDDNCKGQNCPGRIFMATNDARLIALDAVSGKPVQEFGEKGIVNLAPGVGDFWWKGEYQVTSPPAIAGNRVIVGSAVADNTRINAPSGVVRAFDVYTGKLAWSWDLSPPADTSIVKDTLHSLPPIKNKKSKEGYLLGTPNVWAPMSVDEERDLVFIPTGNPMPDYYGGERQNIDYYGSSVVALKGSTGEVVWNFQTVHHDLWDFDVPAQPTLSEVVRDGQKIPVVIQATKMGLVFILNRETGEPVFEVEERPVPQTDVPGEYTSPTQPYPVKPPPLIRHDMTKEEAWGLLGMNGACQDRFEKMHYEGAYTPPRLGQETLMYPGNSGGSNWGGIAVDSDRQILVANVMDLAWIVTLFPGSEYDSKVAALPGVEVARQEGTPYGMIRETFLSPLGLPCNPPPWGTLGAIDLHTGEILWQDAFGTVRDLAPIPLKIKYGVPNLGGPLLTGSGLIFIAASLDNYIRAFDIHSGDQLWEQRLPAGGQATPMTYRIGKDGKQYIVICAGGHGRAGSKLGDSIIAYALPD